MRIFISFILFILIGSYICISSGPVQKNSIPKSDTLYIPYTYWWPSTGPFIGLCGEPFSIVFTGIITKLNAPSDPHTTNDDSDAVVLYTPQRGLIKVENMIYHIPPAIGYKKTPGRNYNNEKYFKFDCFYGLNLKQGDTVIVFVFSYEGEYTIPGNAILKINSFKDPVVLSTEKYIENNLDPISIQDDIPIWKKYGLDYALQQIIYCRMAKKKTK